MNEMIRVHMHIIKSADGITRVEHMFAYVTVIGMANNMADPIHRFATAKIIG